MEIRKMLASDYDGVYKLWTDCKGIGLNNTDDSRKGIEKFLSRNPDTCFVAEEDGRITGAIMAGNDGRRAYIYHTAVHPDYRNRGTGTRLLEETLRALSAQGIGKAALVVFGSNEMGNSFWESHGFTVRGDLVYRNKVLASADSNNL